MPDGKKWTYINQPTIVAPGVDIISTRASTGTLPALAAQKDQATLAPTNLPFYTVMSGTSMATPHVAGIVALMFEANQNLTPANVADIIKRTATNMTGRLAWEAGAGHINAYTAVAEASGVRTGFGNTVNSLKTLNSNELLVPGPANVPFSVDFMPVGTVGEQTFEVGKDIAWVSARATIDANTLALVLTDPDGVRYGSSVALPVLGDTVTTGAPAKPGSWSVTVRGIGSLSGTNVDPDIVTNGYAAPGTVAGTVSFLNSGGYTGLGDVASHPDAPAIEYAVANRLVDGYADGQFRPDQVLKRSELAQYLLMGASVRQHLPFSGKSSFADLAATSTSYAYAESAIASGGPLRNLTQTEDGVMSLQSAGVFGPDAAVTRVSLAYSLVQSLALQAAAKAFSGSLTAFHDGKRIALDDAGAVPANMRGYVQLALDQGVINARFAQIKGPFDSEPTVHAYFDPNVGVTRAAYAVAAGRYLTVYQTGL